MVEVSCFSTTTADAINTAKPCRAAGDYTAWMCLEGVEMHLRPGEVVYRTAEGPWAWPKAVILFNVYVFFYIY